METAEPKVPEEALLTSDLARALTRESPLPAAEVAAAGKLVVRVAKAVTPLVDRVFPGRGLAAAVEPQIAAEQPVLQTAGFPPQQLAASVMVAEVDTAALQAVVAAAEAGTAEAVEEAMTILVAPMVAVGVAVRHTPAPSTSPMLPTRQVPTGEMAGSFFATRRCQQLRSSNFNSWMA